MTDLHVIGGLDVEAREEAKAGRKRAARWRRAVHAYMRAGSAPRLLRSDVMLAEELTNYPSANLGYCYAGQARVADRIGASRRTAQRGMARLKAAGFLVCKRGGQGRTARWTFAISGKALSTLDDSDLNGASRCATGVASRSAKMTPLDATPVAHKPSEPQPFEHQSVEQQPVPSPPPACQDPRARRVTAKALCDELLAGLTARQRGNHRWRAFPLWIYGQLEDGAEPIDIASGVTEALQTLRGETPSTFVYFLPSIRRATARRLQPLPEAGAPAVSARALEGELCRILGLRRGLIGERLGEQAVAALHRRYHAGEAVSTIAKAIRDEVCQ